MNSVVEAGSPVARWLRKITRISDSRTLNARALTHEARLSALNRIAQESHQHELLDRARVALGKQPYEVLSAIDTFISEADGMTLRQRRVACLLIFNLSPNNGEVVAEGLQFLDAFCGAKAVKDNLRYIAPLEFILGARDGFHVPLPRSTPEEKLGSSAVIQYAYEMNHRVTGDIEPETTLESSPDHQMLGRCYRDNALKELLREYPEKVDELIALSLSYETTDPRLLRSLVELDGPTAVAGGWL